MYTYKISNIRVIDGDTIEADIDVGFYLSSRQRFRLLGINTPELRSADILVREQAKLAKTYVEQFFINNPVCYVVTHKADAFGRWLGIVWDDADLLKERSFDTSLNGKLINNNLATYFKM